MFIYLIKYIKLRSLWFSKIFSTGLSLKDKTDIPLCSTCSCFSKLILSKQKKTLAEALSLSAMFTELIGSPWTDTELRLVHLQGLSVGYSLKKNKKKIQRLNFSMADLDSLLSNEDKKNRNRDMMWRNINPEQRKARKHFSVLAGFVTLV